MSASSFTDPNIAHEVIAPFVLDSAKWKIPEIMCPIAITKSINVLRSENDGEKQQQNLVVKEK